MTIRALGTAALFVVLASGTANALVHDSPAAFSAITVNQGTTNTGGAVDPTRSSINSVFDGSNASFFSMGLGGQVAFSITPGNRISGGSAIEITLPRRSGTWKRSKCSSAPSPIPTPTASAIC